MVPPIYVKYSLLGVSSVGALASLIGWACHLGLSYQDYGVHLHSQMPPMWASLMAFVLASHSLYLLIRKPKLTKDNRSSLVATSFYFIFAAILGVMIFFSYIVIQETAAALWSATWIVYSAISFHEIWKSFSSTTSSDFNEGLDINPEIYDDLKQTIRTKYDRFLNHRISRCCSWIFIVIFFVISVMFTFQAVATSSEKHKYKPIGDMVTIKSGSSSYKLHIYCTGPLPTPNATTYVFEAGGGSYSFSFFLIQQELSGRYNKRVCSYDRAGYGWSEAGKLPRSMQREVEELHQLLQNHGEIGPYLLLGHSQGGQLVQLYPRYFSDEVAGLVILDSYSDYLVLESKLHGWSEKELDQQHQSVVSIVDAARAFAPLGFMRMIITYNDFEPADKRIEYLSVGYWDNLAWETQWNELKALWPIREGDVILSGSMGDKPVLMISTFNTVNGSCEYAGIKDPSPNCDDYKELENLYLQDAIDSAKNISRNSTFMICPYPCEHSFVYTKVDWLVQAIIDFGF